MKQKVTSPMPRDLSRRIMRRGAKGGPVVIIFDKAGKPKTNVFGLDEYEKVRETASRVKPSQYRKASASGPDPLGAVEGKIVGGLGRDDIYD